MIAVITSHFAEATGCYAAAATTDPLCTILKIKT